MFEASGQPRPQYRALFSRLMELPADDLRKRQRDADRTFLQQGITFTVYGDQSGTERIFPYDLLPRVLTAAEWKTIERGLTQRLTALNLFLRDIYHDGRILAEGVVPRELVYSAQHYRREMRGIFLRRHLYVSVAGTDLVRLPDGSFAVLEDNLRVPSGVSYMLTNRQIIKRVFPQLFEDYEIQPIDHYGQALLATLRSLAPAQHAEPTIVLLTPGVFNSAYFEHAFLARADGHRAGRRPRPPRPRQRRLHAHHRRPAPRRRDLPPRGRRLPRSAGVPRRFAARRAGPVQRVSRRQRGDHQRDRHGRRRRQGGLRLRAGDHQVLPGRRSDPAEHSDLSPGPAVGPVATSAITSTNWS